MQSDFRGFYCSILDVPKRQKSDPGSQFEGKPFGPRVPALKVPASTDVLTLAGLSPFWVYSLRDHFKQRETRMRQRR